MKHGCIFLIAIAAWSISICQALATVVDPIETVVVPSTQDELAVSVSVFTDGPECPGMQDIYTKVPRSLEGLDAKGASLEIWQGDRLYTHVPLAFSSFSNYKGFERFYGVTFCLRRQEGQRVEVEISYGRGDLILQVLSIDVYRWLEADVKAQD